MNDDTVNPGMPGTEGEAQPAEQPTEAQPAPEAAPAEGEQPTQ